MIRYTSYYYAVYICILPENGHYHARKFFLHSMPLLQYEIKTFYKITLILKYTSI